MKFIIRWKERHSYTVNAETEEQALKELGEHFNNCDDQRNTCDEAYEYEVHKDV